MMTLEQVQTALSGMNLSEVARATGYTRAYVSAIAKGTKSNPTYNAIKSFSDYLETQKQNGA